MQHRCRAGPAARRATAPGRECARRGSSPWRARCAARASARAVRKARAISSVVRPQTSRSVSATCASGGSAGWQQVKISRSRSSSTPSSSVLAASSRLRRRAARRARASDASNRARRRMPSIALKRPVETSHARGLAGTPSRGHCSDRRGEGVVQRLLGEVEVAEQADQRGEDAARLGAVDGVDRSRTRRSSSLTRVRPRLTAARAPRSAAPRCCPRRADGNLRRPPGWRRSGPWPRSG